MIPLRMLGLYTAAAITVELDDIEDTTTNDFNTSANWR